MNELVRFFRNGETGYISLKNAEETFRNYAKEARKVMNEKQCDHIIYGSKEYDTDGNLIAVNFYNMICLSDKEFDERISNITLNKYYVYAIHN